MKKGTIEDNIRFILNSVPQSKKDHNILVLTYWLLFDGMNQEVALNKLTNCESIIRTKRRMYGHKPSNENGGAES